MFFCYPVITPAAFSYAVINRGLRLPPWVGLGAVHVLGLGWDRLMDICLWIYRKYYTWAWPSVSLPRRAMRIRARATG